MRANMLNDISFSRTSKKVYKHIVYLFLRWTMDILMILFFIHKKKRNTILKRMRVNMLNHISFSWTTKKVYKHVVYLFLRRKLDIVLSLLFIVLFLPVGIIIYWLVKGKGEPVFIKRL